MTKGTSMSANAPRSASSSGASTAAVSFAAIGSVLAASSCCLPLFPFMMAAGLAGTAAFLSQVRPYLFGRLDPVYCFGVLSSVAREKMPAPNECGLIGPLVGFCCLRVRVDPFPADYGEPDRRFGSAVIYEENVYRRRGCGRPADRSGPLSIWPEPDSFGLGSAATSQCQNIGDTKNDCNAAKGGAR